MKVKSESEVAQSCPTLSHPMDCSLPGSFVHGILQAKVKLRLLPKNMLRQIVLNTQGAASSFETNPKRVRLRPHYGEGNDTLLQYSCLENPMDGGAW